MDKSYDVVIVGGAVMGSAVACFLKSDPAFHGSVLVVERDPAYEFCSTTRSWGGVRQQFSTPENIAMSVFNVDFMRRAKEILAVDGDGPELFFRENGYLFLGDERILDQLTRLQAIQNAAGAEISILDRDALGRRFPWLNLDGLAGASFGERNEGWIDPHALLQGFRRKARSLGAEYLQGEVVALQRNGRRIDGVALRSGERLAAGTVVLCAGRHSGALAIGAGIKLPVSPKKRMTYVFESRTAIPDMPLTIDLSGLACRPEGRQYLAILSPEADQDPDRDDFELDYEQFEEVIWPDLAHRIPAFEAIRLSRAWAGHYDYNTFDQNAILGPHPEIAGILFCTGFSGHGIQQSPSAGRATAEWLVHGGYRTLDLSRFNYERIPAGRPLLEDAVV